MSEFTDYMQVLTQAETLAAFRGQLEASVGTAYVPLHELPAESLASQEMAEAAWRDLQKPAWVIVHTESPADRLAEIGPAFRLMVEEDFESWAIALECGGKTWGYAMPSTPDAYREATLQDGLALWDGTAASDDVRAMAACLSVDADALAAAMTADGGMAFSALVGARHEQMDDQNLTDYSPGKVLFAIRN